MKEVKRFQQINDLCQSSDEMRRLYPSATIYVYASDYDALAAQIEWIQKVNTLHRQVQILYVVDGYEVTIEWDGNAISPDFHGKTVADAIEKAMADFDLDAAPKWIGGERSVQDHVDRQLSAVTVQRDALMVERDELLKALTRVIERCEIFVFDDSSMSADSLEVLLGIVTQAIAKCRGEA
jgi:hypothetical protein